VEQCSLTGNTSFASGNLRQKLEFMETQKKSYETPAILELGSVAELTQAQNVLGGGDSLFNLLKAGSK
jgi:hypothetical protein